MLAPAKQRRLVILVAALLNLFTHPLATVAYLQGWGSFTTVEIGVVLVEFLGYWIVGGLRLSRAAAIALVANLPTAALSLLF